MKLRTCRALAFAGTFALLSFATSARAASPTEQQGTGAQGARWTDGVVRINVDESFAKLDPAAFEALIGAVSAWQVAAEDLPTLVAEYGGASKLGYKPGEQNRNSVVFESDKAEMANGALAITVLTFDREAGKILDADIVVNGEHRFGIADKMDHEEARRAYDVQNVLTHELGHFLGLGEDYDHQDATMYAYSMPGETNKRDLNERDAEIVFHLYEGTQSPEAVGCGGASIVGRTGANGFWGVFLAAGLVSQLSRRRARKMAKLGTALVLLVASFTAGSDKGEASSGWMTVGDVQSEWNEGLIVSQAALRPAGCEQCAPTPVRFYGGSVGNISQQFGLLSPLKSGQQIWVGGPHYSGARHTPGFTFLPVEE